eukprot:scaffold52333_cov56-Phaeocystis_antarctica.AAC.2
MTTGGPPSFSAPLSMPELRPTSTANRGRLGVAASGCSLRGAGSSADPGTLSALSGVSGVSDSESEPDSPPGGGCAGRPSQPRSCSVRSTTKPSMHTPSASRSTRWSTDAPAISGGIVALSSGVPRCLRRPPASRARVTSSQRTVTMGTASSIGKAAGMMDIATIPAPNPATPCTKPAARKAARTQISCAGMPGAGSLREEASAAKVATAELTTLKDRQRGARAQLSADGVI